MENVCSASRIFIGPLRPMYLNDSMMDLCSVREREPEKVSNSNLKEHD